MCFCFSLMRCGTDRVAFECVFFSKHWIRKSLFCCSYIEITLVMYDLNRHPSRCKVIVLILFSYRLHVLKNKYLGWLFLELYTLRQSGVIALLEVGLLIFFFFLNCLICKVQNTYSQVTFQKTFLHSSYFSNNCLVAFTLKAVLKTLL